MTQADRQRYQSSFKTVRDALDTIGTEFAYWDRAFFEARTERYLRDLHFVETNIPPGRILDVGALPCHLTLLLRDIGYRCEGVDIDPSRAQRYLDHLGLAVHACDIEQESLPFPKEVFDGIVMTEVFEHLRIDPLFTLSELNRVLRPGGHLYLSTPNLYSVDEIAKYARGAGINDPLQQFRFLREKGHMGHMRVYSSRDMRSLLADSGMTVERIDYHNYHTYDQGIIWLLVRTIQLVFPGTGARQLVLARKTGPCPKRSPWSKERRTLHVEKDHGHKPA